MQNDDLKAGIYIHFPFCEKKCRYCDFYSITELDRIPAFLPMDLKDILSRGVCAAAVKPAAADSRLMRI